VSNDRTGFGARSLQAAIDAASQGDTLIINGTCVGPSTLDKPLTLQGVSNKAFGVATLDGDHRGPVLSSGGATIRNLTITNGLGFGIAYAMGLTLIDSVVAGNDGIGIWGADMTIVHSVVADNTGRGIALFAVTFAARIDHSTISGNGGGGVGIVDGAVALTESSVTNNSATQGGGVAVVDGSMYLVDSTVSGNTASDRGGGAYLYLAGLFVTGTSSITGNTAANAGGGVFIDYGGGYISGGAAITGNTPDNCYPSGVYAGCP
jgi:hypothetical protein